MSAVTRITPEKLSPEHVHIGAGSFGLGMVVDLCHRRANFRTAVLSQYSGKDHQDLLRKQQSYAVVFDGDPGRREILKIDLHYYAKDDPSKAVEILAGPCVGLIHYFGWEGKLKHSVNSAGTCFRKKKAKRYCRKALRGRL